MSVTGSSTETSDLVDPLAGLSSSSLFPFSFNRPPSSSSPDHPNPNFDLHAHLKAMALRSPEKLLKQAKTILDDSMEHLKTDKTSAMATENMTDKVFSMNDKNPREKRPALGLKRAKFSVKPMPSQPDVVSEPTLDISKLKDPVEFFAAYERMENAKKELERLRGQPPVNLGLNLLPKSPRPRRPSLFGKSATYKHRSYSSTVVGDSGDTSLSSQKTSEKHITSPTCQDTLPETDYVINSQHTKVSDSTPAMTSEQDGLDELFSYDYGGLDEAGVLDLVQEKMQIKVKDIGKPALPDLLNVQRQESERDTLTKMTDAITRLNGIRKAAGSQRLSLSSQLRENSVYPQVSPAQFKSPLASISLLNRHISKRPPPKDPFSALDTDLLPVRIPSPVILRGRQSDRHDTREDLYESGTTLMLGEENSEVANRPPSMEENITAQSSEPKKHLDGVSRSDQDGAGKDLHECGTSAAHEEETTALSSVSSPSLEGKDISFTSEPIECTDEANQSSQVGGKMDVCDFSRSPVHREQNVADAGEHSLVFEERGIDPSSENVEQENEVDAAGDSAQLELNTEGRDTEKSNVHGGEVLNTEDVDMEEPNKEAAEPSKRKLEERRKSKAALQAKASKETAKEGGKANAQANVPLSERTTNRKRKAEEAPRASKRNLNRRNSLYAAGTKWEAGLRRSTRIKMRPLEYWRGERFLYGRVHDSLVTVIGVKYASPSKEAKQPPVKVKSFVSDEYKELLDLAASH